jgi:hypothetical protein
LRGESHELFTDPAVSGNSRVRAASYAGGNFKPDGRQRMYKLQVQEDPDNPSSWHDVMGSDGSLLTFREEGEARRKLEQLYPVQVKAEKFDAGPKVTRVLSIIGDEDDWPKKK